MVSGIRSLEFNVYNTAEMSILVQYDQDGSGYDIFTGTSSSHHETSLQSKQGSGLSCCFTARNRFAVLLKENQIGIYNLQNELSKSFESPVPASAINTGGSNRVMLRGEDRASLFDLTSRKVVASCSIPAGTRYVVWSPNMAYVAFMAKTSILACTKNLERLHTVHETTRIKSGAWDENGVFIYATQSHVNYMIPKTGDSATIHSLDQPIYIMRANKNHYTYLDRSNQAYRRKFDPTEFLFKIALYEKRFADVKTYLKSARLCGNAIIGYLKRHGHPEVALHFVEDPATRFNLALEYGHLDEAIPAAKTLDNPTIWSRLGKEALRQGNQIIVEMVYQTCARKTNLSKYWDGLTFLYAITGNREKLVKMLKIAEKRNDVMARYHNALMCGLVDQRVKLLAEMGQVPLAALTARTYGLTELVETLEESMGHDVASAVRPDATLLLPPVPVGGEIVNSPEGANWPVITDIAKTFENTLANAEVAAANAPPPPEPEPDFADALEGIDDDDDDADAGLADMGAWGGDDLGLDGAELADIPDIPMDNHHAGVNMGDSAATKWLKSRKLLPDLVAAGAFGEALHFLKLRIGLINAVPLERIFMHAYLATQGAYLPGLPAAPSICVPLLSEGTLRDRSCAPYALMNYGAAVEAQKEAAKLTTQGKFTDALAAYRSLLQSLVLAVATTPEEERGLNDMVVQCKEYVLGMSLEVKRKSLSAETQVARNLELVAYFTCCKLAPSHMALILRVAMLTHFKAQNYITSAYFARRLLSGGSKVSPDLAKQAKQVLANCEQKATDSHVINFDMKAAGNDGNITICHGSFKPIPPTAATVSCPYCQAVYSPEYAGKLCDICELSEIGAKTLGLQFRPI
jgi:coatomer protein complex subunit alpha (xenin)